MNTMQQLYFDPPVAKRLPNISPYAVMCPHCKCIQLVTSSRCEKCSGCGQVFQPDKRFSQTNVLPIDKVGK